MPRQQVTTRAVRYAGASCHAWNGAWTYMTSVGHSNQRGSGPPPCDIRHARGTTFSSSGLSSPPNGSPYRSPTSRRTAAPATTTPSNTVLLGSRESDLRRSDLRRRTADEVGDVARRDEDRVQAGRLERDHLVARLRVDLRDREFARRHVRQQL